MSNSEIITRTMIDTAHCKLVDEAHKLAAYQKSLAYKYGDGKTYDRSLLRRHEKTELETLTHRRDKARIEYTNLVGELI